MFLTFPVCQLKSHLGVLSFKFLSFKYISKPNTNILLKQVINTQKHNYDNKWLL